MNIGVAAVVETTRTKLRAHTSVPQNVGIFMKWTCFSPYLIFYFYEKFQHVLPKTTLMDLWK